MRLESKRNDWYRAPARQRATQKKGLQNAAVGWKLTLHLLVFQE